MASTVSLPQLAENSLWIAWAGMETDLIFNQGVDLPGFASFPLLETSEGRERLFNYFKGLVELGQKAGCGVMLDTVTWMANEDRAKGLDYDAHQLASVNREAVRLIAAAASGPNVILSATIGPRGDGYAAQTEMSVDQAEAYHDAQISVLAGTEVDVISAYTMTSASEAAGMVRSARRYGKPVSVSFTVETNGRLPDGMALSDAIARVDELGHGGPDYYLVNCAHPDHVEGALDGGAWMDRLRGVVANASRCSHAELDKAEELDDGNPVELGQQLAALRARYPQFTILGGCCGTDFRHLSEIAAACRS